MMIGQIPCFAFVAVVLSNAALAGSHVPDLGPAPFFSPVDPDVAELGQLLFYDPILSGNRTVSCASCHHPRFGTGDGVSLSLGDGGQGLGPERQADPDNMPEQRIPRNAPALWNLGAAGMDVMFHDGRLEADPNYGAGIRTPLEGDMVAGLTRPCLRRPCSRYCRRMKWPGTTERTRFRELCVWAS